jgi:hypothetical protein
MMESTSWLTIPKTHSGKSIEHRIQKWNTLLLKLFFFNVFQTGIVCCLIQCFHGDIVLLIVFHYNHTIYPKSEYFVITVLSIIFTLWNSLFNKHQDFYQNMLQKHQHAISKIFS